jgi:hypothetical protein
MKHRPSPLRTTVRRSLASLAVVASLALLVALGSACVIGEAWESDDSRAALPEIDCSGLAEWRQGIAYPAGHVVTDTGDAFAARVAHTSFAPDWNPKRAASLWLATGRCVDGAGGGGDDGGGVEPPAPPPPADDDDGGEQIPPPAEGCQLNGRPGPLFDPAGAKNVGNGNGEQFIGGQCLDASDCASGCCALPCGICSGPGAQFQNGKQGCGFGD